MTSFDVDQSNTDLLILAVSGGEVEHTRLLIEAGANVDAPSSTWFEGLTPLQVAMSLPGNMDKSIRRDQVAVVKLLVEAGADVNSNPNGNMRPLRWATNGRRSYLADYLRAHGAVE